MSSDRLAWGFMPFCRFVGRVGIVVSERNLDLIAAGVAFYAMLAVFPAFAATIALWGFLSDPTMLEGQLDAVAGFMPDDAFALLSRQSRALVETSGTTLGWTTGLSTLVALWSTRTGVSALIRGMNLAFDTQPRDGFVSILWAIAMTLCLVFVALFALASLVIAPIVLSFFPLDLPPGSTRLARWGLTVAVILGTLGFLYRYGPNHGVRRPAWVSVGALCAMTLWAAGSTAFSIYLSNFGSYNEVYGSIGAVIALLMWFFISAYSVLLGAAVSAALLEQKPPL